MTAYFDFIQHQTFKGIIQGKDIEEQNNNTNNNVKEENTLNTITINRLLGGINLPEKPSAPFHICSE